MNVTFENRWIELRGSTEWPLKFSDLTPLNYFLKESWTLDELRNRILNQLYFITPEMRRNVINKVY